MQYSGVKQTDYHMLAWTKQNCSYAATQSVDNLNTVHTAQVDSLTSAHTDGSVDSIRKEVANKFDAAYYLLLVERIVKARPKESTPTCTRWTLGYNYVVIYPLL